MRRCRCMCVLAKRQMEMQMWGLVGEGRSLCDSLLARWAEATLVCMDVGAERMRERCAANARAVVDAAQVLTVMWEPLCSRGVTPQQLWRRHVVVRWCTKQWNALQLVQVRSRFKQMQCPPVCVHSVKPDQWYVSSCRSNLKMAVVPASRGMTSSGCVVPSKQWYVHTCAACVCKFAIV
jgi:hypothetical protein